MRETSRRQDSGRPSPNKPLRACSVATVFREQGRTGAVVAWNIAKRFRVPSPACGLSQSLRGFIRGLERGKRAWRVSSSGVARPPCRSTRKGQAVVVMPMNWQQPRTGAFMPSGCSPRLSGGNITASGRGRPSYNCGSGALAAIERWKHHGIGPGRPSYNCGSGALAAIGAVEPSQHRAGAALLQLWERRPRRDWGDGHITASGRGRPSYNGAALCSRSHSFSTRGRDFPAQPKVAYQPS